MKLLLTALFAFALSACSLIPDAGTAESLTVNYLMSKATTRIVDGDADRADRVLSAVADARAYVTGGDSVTIGALYEAAVDRIQPLQPADRILITAILDNVRARLETAISAGKLEESQRVSLLQSLDWIERSARHASL